MNKVSLVGRLGKDPEVRVTTSGTSVANVSLATSENWKDKDGKKQEKTEWHNLVFYRGLADVAGQYLKKGALVAIEGKLSTESYDKNGETRYITKIVVTDMEMLGGGNKDDHKPAAKADTPVADQQGMYGGEPF